MHGLTGADEGVGLPQQIMSFTYSGIGLGLCIAKATGGVSCQPAVCIIYVCCCLMQPREV